MEECSLCSISLSAWLSLEFWFWLLWLVKDGLLESFWSALSDDWRWAFIVSRPPEHPLLGMLHLPLYTIFGLALLVSNFLGFLYILTIISLWSVGLMTIFSQNVGFSFVLFMVSFALQRLLSFVSPHLSIVDLRGWDSGLLFRKLSTVPMSSVYWSFCFNVKVFHPHELEFCAGWEI